MGKAFFFVEMLAIFKFIPYLCTHKLNYCPCRDDTRNTPPARRLPTMGTFFYSNRQHFGEFSCRRFKFVVTLHTEGHGVVPISLEIIK